MAAFPLTVLFNNNVDPPPPPAPAAWIVRLPTAMPPPPCPSDRLPLIVLSSMVNVVEAKMPPPEPVGNPQGIAVEARAGSLVFWHGNTWHGAYNRRAPGLRVSMPITFCRPYMRSEEDLVGRIPQEMLDRNPARFAMLTQQGIFYGYRSEAHAAENSARAGKVVMAYSEASGGLNALDPLRFRSHD